ncbi:unnamed protein product [Euphydryas editha]|uniref:DDE Tnp4 domain-containing protein n=1 Tax=Euphydryas editha TaxID=104508 RepID=A0AAU9USV2_EUPED|nr:unnamed protein product [Euphydryas editha]
MFGRRRFFAWRLASKAEEADRNERRRKALKRRRYLSPTRNISDTHFVQRYRLSKSAFRYLCSVLEENSDLRNSQRVSLEYKVLSALLFYANGDYQRVVGIANNFSQEAISRYIGQVTEAFNHPNIVRKFIKFPNTREARQQLTENFYNLYGMPGVIRCVDGCQFKIVKPCREEEHPYYCRKHYHSLNVQMMYSKARVIVENTFGRLKNQWRCLCKDRVLHYKPQKCAQIITACSVLHNIALDFKVLVDQEHMTVNQDEQNIQYQEEDPSLLTLGRLLRDRVAS